MLDAMRRGVANVFAKGLLAILVVAFAVWGIGDIVRRPWTNTSLATVGSTQITAEAFQQAYKDEMQSLARRFGRALTPEEARLLDVRRRALSRLIGSAALDLHANNLGVTASDNVVRSSIMGDPTFQGADGQFS